MKEQKEMKENKVKKWLQDHKREIAVGAAAVAGTAIFFILKEKKSGKLNPRLDLSLRLFDGNDSDDHCNPVCRRNFVYTNVNLNNPGLKLTDIGGGLAEVIRRHVPEISDDCKIEHLRINYDFSEIIPD